MALTFPGELAVKDLKDTHCEYNAKLIERYRLLYTGGPDFRAAIEQFLVKRNIEKGGANNPHYQYRVERAWYVNRCSGLIDWLVAEVCKREPKIVAKKDKDGYWDSLNKNADGNGRNLTYLVGQVLRDIFLNRRGYFGAHFPQPVGKVGVNNKDLDARIRVLPASQVRDWETDDLGNLKWCRFDTVSPIRSNPWSQPDKTLHRWSFLTAEQTACYEFIKENKQPVDEATATAKLDTEYTKAHNFTVTPVFPAEVDQELWVMNKIEDPLVALFNREASTTFSLDATAYAMLTLTMDRGEGAERSVVASELAALMLKLGESASFTSPNPAIFEPLFRDSERLKQALYEVLQTLAAQALATQSQNARQAASAKEIDLQPMTTLLKSYAWPVRDALERLVTAIKNHRGEEDNEVEIEGLDEFDATMEEAADQLGADVDEKGKE